MITLSTNKPYLDSYLGSSCKGERAPSEIAGRELPRSSRMTVGKALTAVVSSASSWNVERSGP